MKNQNEIESLLSRQMHGTWDDLNELARVACALAYALGDRDGYRTGYDQGFQIGAAAERGIVSVQNKIDEMESAPAPTYNDAATVTSTPGADSYDVFKEMGLESPIDPLTEIGATLSNIPGSGYEFLKR